MTRLVVIFGFAVAFAAGLVVGMESRQRGLAASPTTHPSRHSGFLTAELNLTPQQEEQIHKIWSETAQRGRSPEQEDRRKKLREQRDAAITALISPQDKPRYDQILKDYSDQVAAMNHEIEAAFASSVERTKQVLTPAQQAKYDELRERHQWGRHGREQNRRADDRAASAPSTQG
jgi:Spy/CpxP family protein refolding chaperone